MPNVFDSDWEHELAVGDMVLRATRVGQQAGARALGAALYEVEAGSGVSPYHVHHANEELLLVLAGRPTVRTPDGERELRAGDLVAFPAGPDGAHRVDNRADEPARVLLVSTMVAPDVVEHPDSRKVLVLTGDIEGDTPPRAFRMEDEVPPFAGELPEPPRSLRDH